MDGKSLTLAENVRGTVVFQPASRQGPTLNGVIDRRGEFQLSAGSSSSVAPGGYLVTVSAVEIQKATEDNPQAVGHRITPAKYADSAASGLRVVVEAGENQVLLELVSENEAESPVKDVEGETSLAEEPTEPLDTQEK